MVTAASEQVLETAVAVGVNPQTPAFTGKFQHRSIFFPVADSYNFIEVIWNNLECVLKLKGRDYCFLSGFPPFSFT